eukprot:357999-Chlamydomonas_euryale.AAC.1
MPAPQHTPTAAMPVPQLSIYQLDPWGEVCTRAAQTVKVCMGVVAATSRSDGPASVKRKLDRQRRCMAHCAWRMEHGAWSMLSHDEHALPSEMPPCVVRGAMLPCMCFHGARRMAHGHACAVQHHNACCGMRATWHTAMQTVF